MSVAHLKLIMAAPASPVEPARTEGWCEVESRLGTGLPVDYKEFVSEFGTGCIGEFIWILNPFSQNPHLNLLTQFEGIAKTERDLKAIYGPVLPLPLFPAPNGLLPVGLTDNGDHISWLTGGKPDTWAVVVSDSRGPEWERFDQTLTSFIAIILGGERVCGIFPEDFPPASPTFRSVRSAK